MLSEGDLNYVFQALAHETRRKIIKLLAEEGPMQFTELMEKLGIEETGTFGFHIKRLNELLERTGEGKYKLSELGQLAYNIIRFAEGGKVEEIGEVTPTPTVKVFNNIAKLLVDRTLLEKYNKVAFDWIGTLLFTEDVDEELFKSKVLYFRGVGTIVVPKKLLRLAYGRLESMCGDIIGYEGELPRHWIEFKAKKRIKDIENYTGTFILTKDRLERAREQGYVLRIENYSTLVIDRDVPPELFSEVVHSIESYGPIYAPKNLHRVIMNKVETGTGVHDIEEWEASAQT